jgi:hypothetical protein
MADPDEGLAGTARDLILVGAMLVALAIAAAMLIGG